MPKILIHIIWNCLGRVKTGTCIIAKCQRTDLVICSHSLEGKSPFYSRINTVLLDKAALLFSFASFLKRDQVRGPGFDTRSGNILSFLLPLFQEGQLSVTGESMCTKYWFTA